MLILIIKYYLGGNYYGNNDTQGRTSCIFYGSRFSVAQCKKKQGRKHYKTCRPYAEIYEWGKAGY
jgi:hypothetical protein